MDLPLFLFKHENGKDRKEKGQEEFGIYLWLSLGSSPCQHRTQFLQEGAPEIELTLHLMSFLVAYSLSL